MKNKSSDTSNKGFWQRFARLYAPAMQSSHILYDAICGRIRPRLCRNMDVLELACGTGQLSFPLCGWVHQWEATDFSEAMITEAKKRTKAGAGTSAKLHFSVQDATALPYAENSFDAVVISNALHIMPFPQKALSEIRRVLKPEGLLFAPTFIHGDSTGFRLRVRLMELAGFHTYHKWNAGDFISFISQNGFDVTDHRLMGDSLAPLCYLEARKGDSENDCRISETAARPCRQA